MPPSINLNQPQFLDVLNALPDPTLFVNGNGEIIFASQKTEPTFGYKPDELVGQKIEVLMPETYRENHIKHRANYFDKPSVRSMGSGLELQGQRKDGSTFPTEISLNYIDNGQEILAICTVRDISERNITEKLLVNDERFQLLMQNAPAAIAMFDKEMRYLVVSKRWLEDYALADQDIIGRSHYEIFPDIPERWQEVHRRCLAGETLRVEEDSFHKADGKTDWVRWEMRPWHDNGGNIGGAILFIQSITRRKKAEDDLKKSAEKFRAIFDNAVMGIAVGELESGKFYLANQAYCQLLGYTFEELKGISFKTLAHPDDLATQTKEIMRLVEEGLPSIDLINRYIKKNGDTLWVRKFIRAFPSDPGEPQLLLAVVMDYTAVKQAEDELKNSHENLERLVQERTRELEFAKQEAERADNIKSRFLTAASHDLRQPLQSSALCLSVLSSKNKDPQCREMIDVLCQSMDTMTILLNGLLDISKFHSGKVAVNCRDFLLDDMLSRIVSDSLQQAKAKGLNLTYQKSDCLINSDPDLLERITENLVANAIKYTQEGQVSINLDYTDRHVLISVADTGSGIPAAELDNIFAEYYQLDNPARDRSKGFGLGLAIVKYIAQILDHPIAVRSEPGKGSVFTVTVPLGQQHGYLEPEKLGEDPGQQGEIEVLIIEDDPMIIKAMQILFKQKGIKPHTAESGEKAIANIRAGFHPDVIISDYRLPGCNGIDTVKQIRELLVDMIPVIIISGDTSLKTIEAELLHCQVFLKPIDAKKLISTVIEMATRKPKPLAASDGTG